MRAAQEPRETWGHLIQFGWAPGGYMCSACSDCGQQHQDCDKRAWRCRPCAEKKHAEFVANPPEPVKVVDVRDLLTRSRDTLKLALAPFKPRTSKAEAEAEALVQELDAYLNSKSSTTI